MSNQYHPDDPYSASLVPDANYYTDSHHPGPTEFSPFFTSDYLPLSTPPTPSTALPPTFNTAAYPYATTGPPSTTAAGTGNSSTASYNDVEEEKRRRNTAASARFRVKKKEREQVLEKTANEVRERVRGLEGRVQMLERENGWLRGLVGEKRRNLGLGGGRGRRRSGEESEGEREREGDGKQGEVGKRKGRRKESVDEKVGRSPRKRNDGVGTGR